MLQYGLHRYQLVLQLSRSLSICLSIVRTLIRGSSSDITNSLPTQGCLKLIREVHRMYFISTQALGLLKRAGCTGCILVHVGMPGELEHYL